MKKGLLLSTINWILVFSIPGILVTTDITSNTINSSINTKNLNTNLFQKVIETQIVEKEIIEEENNEKEEIEEVEIPTIKKVQEQQEVKEEPKKEVQVEEKQVETVKEQEKAPVIQPKTENKQSNVLATYSGKASYYTANCYGCGGYTSSGLNVSDGRLYYNDSKYGNVRIIAAGREIPLYSIVRLSNTKVGSNVLAIVLDRGGDIGEGRVFLIDILTNSQESFGGVDKGVKVEVLRSGR